jgi:pilus assembly protein Flp/PilA
MRRAAVDRAIGLKDRVSWFLREESGQDVVEYGLLIATIAIIVLIGVGIFGSNINAWFQSLAGRITTVGT